MTVSATATSTPRAAAPVGSAATPTHRTNGASASSPISEHPHALHAQAGAIGHPHSHSRSHPSLVPSHSHTHHTHASTHNHAHANTHSHGNHNFNHLHSPPASVASASAAHSPVDASESPSSYFHSQHSQSHYGEPQSTYSHLPPAPQRHYLYSSSLPADSLPRTFARSPAYDKERYVHPHHEPPSPSSYYPPSVPRQNPHSHQAPPGPSPTSKSSGYTHSHSYDDTIPRTNNHNSNGFSNISSNLPEYSYPMTPSHRSHRDQQRPFLLQHHRHYSDEYQHSYHASKQAHSQESVPTQNYYTNPQDHSYTHQRPLSQHHHQRPDSSHRESTERQETMPHQKPPPIQTKWTDDMSRGCPPFSYHSGSGYTSGYRSADSRISPATPRSVQIHGSYLRTPISAPHVFTESPFDYREPSHFGHTIASSLRGKYDLREDEMEHCSERDDVHEREHRYIREGREVNEEHGEDDYAMMDNRAKKQKVSGMDTRPPVFRKTSPSRGIKKSSVDNETEDDGEEDAQGSHLTSNPSSRKQSDSGSVNGDERSLSATKAKKAKTKPQKRGPRRASFPTNMGEVIDQIEDEVQVKSGSQSEKGLRAFAQRVYERVEALGSTLYSELVQELYVAEQGGNVDTAQTEKEQENIRRRVYDVLNVLKALGIIIFDNKDIRWVGIEESPIVQEVTSCQAAATLTTNGGPPEDGGDDESEEPEDDEMEIEKLQKKVDAMKLEIELEQAKLQDQLTRHVQVLNLVKRNKRREAKEEERAERRRLRKERRARATDEDQAMTDVGPQGSSDLNEEVQRRSERHRRHRSPRHTSGDATANGVDANGLDIEEEDEEARQRRKQERRERRERKERRAQRRRDREQERLPLPMVVVRMPGYAGQSSDSESNISVVRRVREEQKPKRGSKSKRRCESTGQEITMVEIQIPQQDELSIISDTEILGDLGFNTVTMDELETMLPKNLIDAVKYTVNSEERHNRSPRGHRRMRASEDMLLSAAAASDTTDGDSTMTATDGDADMMSGPTCITVRGGFEREIVRAASEGVSASS